MPTGRDRNRSDIALAYEALAGAFGAPGDGDTSTIALSGTAAAATGLVPGDTYLVTATAACHVLFDTIGAAGDATTSDAYLVGNVPYFFRMSSDADRCSAIESAGGGTLYLTRLGG